jgi:hypothetical protein
MQAVSLTSDRLRIAGALDFDQRSTGLVPRRLPAWTRPQLPDVMVGLMVQMASGVRLELQTDASEIELDVLVTILQYTDLPPASAVFDLVIDRQLARSVPVFEGNRILVTPGQPEATNQHGDPTTVRFSGLGNAMKHVEIWLPQGATVALRELRVSDGSRVSKLARDKRKRWVHYGSSISHGMEADGPTGTWPAVAARFADVHLQSLGFGGQCHLDQFVARTIRDLPADYISVKAGINVINHESLKERTYISALHGFLDTVRDGHPQTPLLVVSPIFCPSAEDHPGPTLPNDQRKFVVLQRPSELMTGCLTLRRVRTLMKTIVHSRRDAGDANLHYLDGLELFSEADAGDLPDDLHPNDAGYRRMGERFYALAFTGSGPFARK